MNPFELEVVWGTSQMHFFFNYNKNYLCNEKLFFSNMLFDSVSCSHLDKIGIECFSTFYFFIYIVHSNIHKPCYFWDYCFLVFKEKTKKTPMLLTSSRVPNIFAPNMITFITYHSITHHLLYNTATNSRPNPGRQEVSLLWAGQLIIRRSLWPCWYLSMSSLLACIRCMVNVRLLLGTGPAQPRWPPARMWYVSWLNWNKHIAR